jgi:hypothetical protein
MTFSSPGSAGRLRLKEISEREDLGERGHGREDETLAPEKVTIMKRGRERSHPKSMDGALTKPRASFSFSFFLGGGVLGYLSLNSGTCVC